MYEIQEISLANLSRLYSYMQQDLFKADFSLKGFDYPWAISSRPWKQGEKVLDVGAAYSPFPMHLQETYGCEMWVADDYGLKSDDPYWTRNASPPEHFAKHPNVKFVLERLGDPATSSLPAGYFDVVYSISVLEHVPYPYLADVWKHMDMLLKPGGEMLHAIDVPFPSNGGLKKTLMALGLDSFYFLFPKSFRLRHFLATPANYARLALGALNLSLPKSEIGTLKCVLDPDVLTENLAYGLKRIVKDQMKDYRYQRVASLLVRMKKL